MTSQPMHMYWMWQLRSRKLEHLVLHDLPVKKSITLSHVLRHKVLMASMKPLMPPFLCCFGGLICVPLSRTVAVVEN